MSKVENERKRSIGESSETGSKKRKPLHQLSETGPLTQSDVVYFQKEAIWRQMISYKEQCRLLSDDAKKYQHKFERNESKIKVLLSWYDEIVALFNKKIPHSNDKSSSINEKLLISLDGKLDEHLDQRRTQLLELLSPLVDGNNKLSLHNEDITALNTELNTLKVNASTLSNIKLELESRIKELQEELLHTVRQHERNNSKSVKRVDDSLTKKSNGDIKKEDEQVESKPQVQQANGSKVEDGSTPSQDNEVIKEELQKLKSEVEILNSSNELLNKQIHEITEKYNKSQQELLQLDNKLHHLEEADLVDNIHYKKVVKNNQSLQDQIVNLTKINSSSVNKLSELELNQNNVKQSIQKEILEENEKLKDQLNKCELDLVRVRTNRDDLIAKQAILKTQIDSQPGSKEVDNLNKVLSDRIEQLTKDHLQEVDESIKDEKYQTLSKEDLVRKVEGLSNEIKEIELAFKETRDISLKKLGPAVDQENLIRKLTIEKTKADQKYFASMRVKDSLNAENKVMKAQISKSQELIKNLNDLEKNYLNKIELLTKSLSDYKSIKETSLQENSKLQDTVKSLKLSKDSLQKEIDRFSKSIEEKVELINNLQAEKNHHEIVINKLEKNLKSTESLLQKYKQNNTSLILQEDEQQLEALRSIAKCSVCTKNWKDTAITVCGHVFCHHCTQERLAARLRRCPSCNKGFSVNDLLSVHL